MQTGRAKQAVGRWGEQRAVNFVQTLGWQVVDRNWRCAAGELDLVAKEPDGTVVVIEVNHNNAQSAAWVELTVTLLQRIFSGPAGLLASGLLRH